ncbi:MAG: kelch repeat-containing protein [Acidobacteriota bacterium]
MFRSKGWYLNNPLCRKFINICILFSLAFAFTIPEADAQNNPLRFVWKKLELDGQGPFADREFVSLIYDSKRNRLILFGGGLHGRNYNDIWAVDLDKNTWTKLEAIGARGEIPEPRAMHSAAYIPESDRMVVFGSDGTGLMFADYNVYSFDLKTSRWSVIKTKGEHHPRMVRTAMLYIGDEKILLFGGCLTPFGNLHGAGSINQITLFDLKTGQWTKIESKGDIPPPHTNPAVALDRRNHRAIMFMGSTFTDRESYLSEVYVLDLRNWTWTKLQTKNPPSARGYVGHALLEDLNRLIIFGGWDGNWQRQSALGETYSLNLDTLEWEKLEFTGSLPSPRAPFTAASDGKRMFIYGGWAGVPRWGSLYNDVWELSYEK